MRFLIENFFCPYTCKEADCTVFFHKLENKELAFRVVEGGLLIKPTKKTRQGWKQEFDKVLKHKEGDQIDNEWLEAPLVEEEDWEFSSP